MTRTCPPAIAATVAVLAAVAGCGTPSADPPAVTSPPQITPAVVTVALDVTGPGLGVITHSTSSGAVTTTPRAVLQGWHYTYETQPRAAIVLTVDGASLGEVSCAVHIDGQLRVSDTGLTPDCGLAVA